MLAETTNPAQGLFRGRLSMDLLLRGKDADYVAAAKLGRLFVPFDENGWPIEKRVARHLTLFSEGAALTEVRTWLKGLKHRRLEKRAGGGLLGLLTKFINQDGYHITTACRRYLSPLIQGENVPPFRAGLPALAPLKRMAVRRRLATDFTP